jgi:NDP-sugar pyrophosphorylase family protein
MSGAGKRFVRRGYQEPKPLIQVDGAPMIEHVVGMFPGESDFLFICSNVHLESTPLASVLERLVPGAPIVGIEPHTYGPVYAALRAEHAIKDDEPVILNYCDFSVGWDYTRFRHVVTELGCAGCISAYRGFHPHSLGPNQYAYMREANGHLLEIREKQCFTEQRLNEYASAGTYYFQSGALLKHYFRRAINEGLQTAGEYYASMPYNLMVRDGLDVHIYELDYFLQWGTPEDLEEYQKWSDYFSHPRKQPRPRASPTINLIPMAGAGTRFAREGYSAPKPLVEVAGVPMSRRALDTLPPARRWIAACRSDHLDDPRLYEALRAGGRNLDVISVPSVTDGQARTCLLARDVIDPDAPLLIGPCDAMFVYDEDRYEALTADPSIDCLIWTFRNHPHANRNPQQWGWVRTDAEGTALGISCKVPISNEVSCDPGIIGVFWFRKGSFFLSAVDALIAEDRRVNGEFYVDSAINVLLDQGRRAKVFDVQHFISLGNPDDVRTYEYWFRYFTHAAQPAVPIAAPVAIR